MQISNGIRFLRSAIVVSLAVFSCTASWAARDFTPQAGTWVISEELDGKPGRGLAIDVQGNTFFMQVFGYEKNGDATFYTATGQMEGNTVTAPLMQYQGGRSFGGEARDAVETGSLGNVTLNFTNGLVGTIQLPGEPTVAIERFLVNDRELEDAQLQPTEPHGSRANISIWWVQDQQGKFTDLLSVYLTATEKNPYQVTIYRKSETSRYSCERTLKPQAFHCISSADNSKEPKYQNLRFQMVGSEVVGNVTDKSNRALRLVGTMRGLGPISPAYVLCAFFDYTYMPSGCDGLRIPSNGTWIISDELTGKPGRGLSVDRQGQTVILQVFDYLPNGQPTFHMGSSLIGKDPFTGTYNEDVVPLKRYRGGRFLGGPTMPGTLVADAPEVGNARLDFNGVIENQGAWYISGTLQLPGEDKKFLNRLDLQSQGPLDRLQGEWIMNFSAVQKPEYLQESIVKTVRLSKITDKSVMSDDGLIVCSTLENNQYKYKCNLYNDSLRLEVVGSTEFMANGFTTYGSAFQLRDKFGNWRGVGDVVPE